MASVCLLAGVGLAAPQEGKPAPAFEVPATSIGSVLPGKKDAKTLSLADLKGKHVVLFFYPKALTKGCTIESCGFRDLAKEFAQANTVIVGASHDTVELQQKFTDTHKLPFPLLADTEMKVSKAYGTSSGKGNPARHTFVIDKEGVLRKIYTKVTPAKHPQEVLEFVKTLK
ncbi:MAG: peroxiredoxin, partial [Gemmataceae bacterium]